MGERVRRLRERAKDIGERIKPHSAYIKSLIIDLFFRDPETLLTKFPSIRRRLEEDPSFIYRIREVVESHSEEWDRASSIDLYDASISAAQLASLLASYGIDVPVERLGEIIELAPKVPYIVDYARRAGKLPAALLALYELVTFLDITNLMDLFPTYRAAELYAMYKELIEEEEPYRLYRTSESTA